MEYIKNNEYRFDDRREYDTGPPTGYHDRRETLRREDDRFRVMLKRIFDLHMEDTISDEQIKRILEPIVIRIKAGEFSAARA